WLRHAQHDGTDDRPIGLVTYVVLKRLDDLAYGAGLWGGVVREHSLTALKPQIRS
ncbi:MAG: mycofactocin system glycosyltransferase, partial [Mycobacterium sp.]